MREWLRIGGESIDLSSGDRIWACEDEDPRIPGRRVVVGGFVDGRPGKPGVILAAITSDGHCQELGVSSADQARAVMSALISAWPELGCDETPAAGTPLGDGTVGE